MARIDTAALVVGLVEQLADRGEDLQASPSPRRARTRAGLTVARSFELEVLLAGAVSSASSSSRSTCSENPKRSWKRRSGPGAHQLASPARRMNAGTSVERIRKASTSTAR